MKYLPLFAMRTGSKLYGTDTASSDTDIKLIIAPALGEVLIGTKSSTQPSVYYTSGSGVANTHADVDVELIPFPTFARHFVEGQAYAIEMAYAIDGTHASQTFWNVAGERCDPSESLARSLVLYMRSQFTNSSVGAMMSYAINQAHLYGERAGRLIACTAFAELFDSLNLTESDKLSKTFTDLACNAAVPFHALAAKHPDVIEVCLYQVSSTNRQPCFKVAGKHIPWTVTVGTASTVIRSTIKRFGSRVIHAVDATDWKSISHAARVLGFVDELISHGTLTLPVPESTRARLLSIKHGEYHRDQIQQELDADLTRIQRMVASNQCAIPSRTAELDARFNSWLIAAMCSIYGVDNINPPTYIDTTEGVMPFVYSTFFRGV